MEYTTKKTSEEKSDFPSQGCTDFWRENKVMEETNFSLKCLNALASFFTK